MKILRSPATLLLFVAILLGAYGASAIGAGGSDTSMGMPDGSKHMGGSGDWLSIGSTFHYNTPYFKFYSGYYPYNYFSYTNYYPVYTNYYSYSYPNYYPYSYFSYYPYSYYSGFHYSFTSSSYFSSHS